MKDLVAFLRARFDEDEQAASTAAEEAGEPSWTDGGPYADDVRTDGGGVVATGPWTAYLPDPLRVHIARHDPARVLREVEAKRRMLAVADMQVGGQLGELAIGYVLLLMLALPYADHEDYQEEWKP